MDVDDVSDVKQFFDLLIKQKAVLQNASKRTGEIPSNRKPLQQ